ncbi:Oidioi.mRNA.OKI2018_I69.chr2.g7130.t1.cds [Oikopleura dioica]|uniref:Oidioi.mRNA.OKI2018_I69.chr2.g7130.t1.cds n=1 Tax=Oikopleura dioica TaxID=34765 RepID=A0ABN7TEB2_OIKDI|nr:Oidioi.mRNA.OKI2018_I69.chr2.g7130.t1.cds [Oikopleura dioica]
MARQKSPPKKKQGKPGSKAIKEIREYQKSTDLLMRKMPFQRVVREVVNDLRPGNDYRWQSQALLCLQEATEAFIITTFEVANLFALHSKRVTIMKKDLDLVNAVAQFNLNGIKK